MAAPIKRIASRFAVNEFVAARLRESADLLAAQQDNPFRVLAYRRAAESIASLDHSVEELLREGGVEALDRIPHVGKGIAAAIAEMATTGRWAYLQRLRGSAEPEDVFCAIPRRWPQVGEASARRTQRGHARAVGSGPGRSRIGGPEGRRREASVDDPVGTAPVIGPHAPPSRRPAGRAEHRHPPRCRSRIPRKGRARCSAAHRA